MCGQHTEIAQPKPVFCRGAGNLARAEVRILRRPRISPPSRCRGCDILQRSVWAAPTRGPCEKGKEKPVGKV